MNVTVNAICYKSKVLNNSESPLMIRICKSGKRKYISLGVSVLPEHWDFTQNKPKNSCPNRIYIETLIINTLKKYSEQLLEFKAMEREFTIDTLIERVNKPTKLKTVDDVFKEQLERLKDENRTGYMLSTKQVYNSLLKFNKHLNIYFSDIDISWLRKYEVWLRKQGIVENTIGIRFRTLRTVFNVAIEEGIVKSEYYPFKKYKVSKLHQETAKRAICKDDINRIMQYQSSEAYTGLAVDIFTFSYLMGGINFVDMANLKTKNIIEDLLIYTRQKTGKLIKIPLHPKALEIINKYHNPNNPYLLPILSAFHKTEQQRINRIHKVITKINKRLKDIGKELDIPIKLTTYVCRHSAATQLKKAGVSTSIISQVLGHSSEKVTQVYLDSFGNEQINEAMKNLL